MRLSGRPGRGARFLLSGLASCLRAINTQHGDLLSAPLICSMANKFGLSREIPSDVKREVRRRSKFGCVICRAGVYTYEHIEPKFAEAREHDPMRICCLCDSCHSKVTRRQYSKEFVARKYEEVAAAPVDRVRPPYDFLDFHNGKAGLHIGGIQYEPGVKGIIKYHGQDVVSVSPVREDESNGINACFFDDEGGKSLNIKNNVWEGALEAWDTEVVGPRIKVRKREGVFSLVLRLEPPGVIVVEWLDMRISDAHILASEHAYAVGRYISQSEIFWFSANVVEMGAPGPEAAAIEFLNRYEAHWRDEKSRGRGKRMEGSDGSVVFQTGLGIAHKNLGIIVGSNCFRFGIGAFAVGGPRCIRTMRRAVRKNSEQVARFIGTGKL